MATTHVYKEEDEYDQKYTEPSQNDSKSNDIEEDDIFNSELLTDIINDDDYNNDDLDPSISDIEHSKTPTKKHRPDRKKSKSSNNVISHLNPNINRPRRHSESSSESHSTEYHKNKNKKINNKKPILIPLNVNGKNQKDNKKSPPKSLRRSILSRYKSVTKLQSKTTKTKHGLNSSSNDISVPLNVQHLIHVEWDDKIKAYKGIPDVWHSKIPQSQTVPYESLRLNRSISLTTNTNRNNNNINIINHQQIRNINNIVEDINEIKVKELSDVPIDYVSCNDSLAMPLPGPRVFINKNKSDRNNNNSKDIIIPSSDFDKREMSVIEYLKFIGINNLSNNKKQLVHNIRNEFYIKMGFSAHDRLLNIPRHIQQLLLTYLDIKSYLRICITCSSFASFLDDPIIWKIQVLYKSKVQGTLHKTTFPLRHRVWKATYMSMVKIDKNPSYYDYVWNIIVAGDTKHGQNRLVVSLGKHWRCKLTGLEPVISAVNGTYRFGVDFVIRRVIIRDIIIKLQVWDGGNVMADTSLLKSVNIFLILFDLTNKNSFSKIKNIARNMITLLPYENIKLLMVGNTTNNENNRVISYESAKRFANERGLMYIEANTDNNIQSINNAFVNLAEECIHAEYEKKALKNQKALKNTNCLIQ